MNRVFVYGTLKEGFRNFHVNRGRRLPGEFITVHALPLYVIGPYGLPWLVHQPGTGHAVTGQVFAVDDATLAAMDVLERVNEADGYIRLPLSVRPAAGGDEIDVLAYFGNAARLARETVHHGPVAVYTLAHQALYRMHL